ncbi:MAG: 2-deoxyribose-5-phosphate aldolase [Candidatus Pacebacteria bacterium]|nr:2-deoxyribose-5-phosphate aldolase [Candidatus Paceibacterota bacterium]
MKNIAKIIDQTNIKPNATANDIKKTCQEAKKYDFRGVCVNPEWVKLVKNELSPVRDYKGKEKTQGKQISNGVRGTDVKVVCLIDPPMGQSQHSKRIQICQKAKKDGADELDVVISIPDVKQEKWGEILKDLKEISKILPTKVIIGSGYLTDEEIIKVSQIVKKAGAICVKTATEKDPLEHRELKEKFYHLKLMKKGAPGLLIKVAGKIRNLSDVKEAIKAGADIIGTSSGVKIIEETKKL